MNIALTKKGNVLGATLLVTGCCIGAGMIGLPVSSAAAGFFPFMFAMIVSYLFTTGTGLLLLEATLWFEQKVNLLSIAQFALGNTGRVIAGGLFLFLFYSILIAYMDGGAQLFSAFSQAVFHYPMPRTVGILTCVVFVGAVIYVSTALVVKINRILMIGLIASYLAVVIVGLPKVNLDHLIHTNWTASLATLPILFICFGYQNLVPSLTYYLKKNVQILRFAIIIGNLLPLFFYLIWNFVILGMLPTGSSLQIGNEDMVSGLLQKTTQSSSVLFFVQLFSFFALTTSFLAIGISFVDFFKDGLKVSSLGKTQYEFLIYGLVVGPPMLFCVFYPNIFLQALEFAGGFVDVILFGILPVFIVWKGRYSKKVEGSYRVAGGKIFLGSMLLISLIFLLLRLL
ncbi:MAG: aromatic amino acid transport family protein [Rhabdochlamydiaceae bacterium]|jgi:tyrosine-specific transport protein